MNEYKDTEYANFCSLAKAVLKGKFINLMHIFKTNKYLKLINKLQ